ncbi:hypothetical protein [Nocardiopsis composta]|uniref:Uncharacterized protein n=1 Tax=Nocardiopsis composta TaxID=157465 RepID=A0A7W8QIU8_9ACTN|nr:hypothetical protein [Nocardiopsis composta]MBB5431287.1 hypothetical protein [Nocardiopsis composta]
MAAPGPLGGVMAAPQTLSDSDDLKRLQKAFPGWRIWRSLANGRPAGWIATRLVDDEVEPTIIASGADELAERLTHPGRRAGRGVSRVQSASPERCSVGRGAP